MSNIPSPRSDDALDSARGAIPRLVDRKVSGGDTATLKHLEGRCARVHTSRGTQDVILDDLHAERATLTRKRRLGTLSTLEASQLVELEAYIDELELSEEREAGASVWAQLEEIAGRVVAVGAGIQRRR